ncbi:MAG: hypothetical protein HZA29_04085 [Candidatus Omnitrophica bacterium]|nr:hypothetical protein [Candidatus Omnitrophota bacterium]
MVSFHKRGLVLLASIILLVFASIAVLSVTTFIVQRFSEGRAQQRSLQSVYLAQAGINQAIYSYRTTGANAYFTPGQTTLPGDPGSSFILGGTASAGFDADFLMVDANSGSWSATTYDTIAVRSQTTGSGTTNASDGTFTVNKPASVSNNDYLVCIIGKKAANVGASVAPPLGWTVGDQLGTTLENDVYGGTFYKKITNAAGEPATYAFDSNGTSETFGYWTGSLSGIDQTTPEDVSFSTGTGQWVNSQNDRTPNLPSVTTVTPQAFALGAWSLNSDTATNQPGSPWANRADDAGGLLNVMSQTVAAAGTATGTASLSAVAVGQETQTGTFVFRPAVVPRRLDYGRIKSVIDPGTRTLTITQMAVTWTTASRTLQQIWINGVQRWSGSASSGQTVDISDVPGINPAGVTTNYLVFDADMQTGSLTLTATYYLSDNSTRTVTLWPNSNNFRFTVKASGKKTGSNLYRTIQAEYNASTSKVVDYREIDTQMQ